MRSKACHSGKLACLALGEALTSPVCHAPELLAHAIGPCDMEKTYDIDGKQINVANRCHNDRFYDMPHLHTVAAVLHFELVDH